MGDLAQVWILQGLVPEDRIPAAVVGLQGSGRGDHRQWRRMQRDRTVSISSPSTSFLWSLIQQREGKGKGISLLFLFKAETKGEAV